MNYCNTVTINGQPTNTRIKKAYALLCVSLFVLCKKAFKVFVHRGNSRKPEFAHQDFRYIF